MAQLDRLAWLERQERVVAELVFLDLVGQQATCQCRGVDRHAGEFRQHVRQGADVILVGMRDDEGLDLAAALLEIGDIGDDEVDADGIVDLVVANALSATVSILLGNGDGSFQIQQAFDGFNENSTLDVADLNGDDLPDIVSVDYPLNKASILLQIGGACLADINADGELNILDFVAFQALWLDHHASADCDANLAFNILDFVCFQQLFVKGCK
jgi:hypothetical protein